MRRAGGCRAGSGLQTCGADCRRAGCVTRPPPPLHARAAPPAQALAQALPPLSVGLVATFTTVACIIAADTGAYFVGKNLGRTKLTDISPKKTVEGAVGGMASAVGAALALRALTGWPGDAAAAAGYGVLMFVSSLFGDLIESIMKREAGMKVRSLRMCGGGWGRAVLNPAADAGRAPRQGWCSARGRRAAPALAPRASAALTAAAPPPPSAPAPLVTRTLAT